MSISPRAQIGLAMGQPLLEESVPFIKEFKSRGGRERFYLRTKRVMDIVVSIFLLLILWPVMLITAVAIKITSRGPVLFRQRRAGLCGKPFVMYKFRSMSNGAEARRRSLNGENGLIEGPCFKLFTDPRLTLMGRFIRETSIDELPQLFNVLKGEMTLVGPRPLPLYEVCTDTPAERTRLRVHPGLTCLWQISGRNEIPYFEWIQLDLYYIKHRSVLLDAKILVKTIPAVLSRRGAF